MQIPKTLCLILW